MSTITSLYARAGAVLIMAFAALVWAPASDAQTTSITITVTGGKFVPSTITAPANTRFTLTITNMDNKAVEFEGVSLRVEKIVAANATATVNVRALAPGTYEFFDDFNASNRGTLVVK